MAKKTQRLFVWGGGMTKKTQKLHFWGRETSAAEIAENADFLEGDDDYEREREGWSEAERQANYEKWHYCPTDGLDLYSDEVERRQMRETITISLIGGLLLAMTGSIFVAGAVVAWVGWELFDAPEDIFTIVPDERQFY